MPRTPLLALALAVLLTPALAACGADRPAAAPASLAPASSAPALSTDPTTDPTTSPTRPTAGPAGPAPASSRPAAAPSEPADPPGPGVPFRADLLPDTGGPTGGGGLSVVDVRTARQDGYDRVVVELAGTGAPGWSVRYVDRPTADGSGAPVAVAGDAFLQVSLRGVGLPADTGVPAFAGRVAATGTTQVREVVVGPVLEGVAGSYVGISGARRPFRVFALAAPPRLVLDVRDR